MSDTTLHVFFSHGRLEAALTRDPELTGRALTWVQLVQQLALPAPTVRRLDEVGALFLLYKVLKTPLEETSPLPTHLGPGLVRAIVKLIRECRAGCITPDQLEFLAGETNDARLAAVAGIYRRYLEALSTGIGGVSFSDPDGDVARACANLRKGLLPRGFHQRQIQSVMFHDPLDLSPAEGLVVLALTRALKGMGTVTLSVPDLGPWPSLQQEFIRWREMVLPEALIEGDLFLHVRSWPTRPDELGCLTKTCPDPPISGAIHLGAATSVEAELQDVAVRIRSLLQSGVAPETIAICLPHDAQYEGTLADTLNRVGVPWRPRGGRSLAKTSLVKGVLSLPRLVLKGWPREELINLFTSGGAFTTTMLLGAGWHDGAEVADLLRLSGVQKQGWAGGGYREHLTALARQLQAQKKEREATRALELGERLDRLFEKVEVLTQPGSPGQLVQRLRDLLLGWGLLPTQPGQVVPEGPDILHHLSAHHMVEEHGASRLLRDVLEQVSRASRQVEWGELPGEESLQLLKEVVSTAHLPVRGARGGTVVVVSLTQLAARSFDYVMMVGMSEGKVPTSQAPDPLLSDEQRLQLDPQFGGLLYTSQYRRSTSLRNFWLGLLAAQKKVYLSNTRLDDNGNILLASPYVEELRHQLPQLEIQSIGVKGVPHTLQDLAYHLAGRLEQGEVLPIGELPGPPGLWDQLQYLSTLEKARLDFFLGKGDASSFTGSLSHMKVLQHMEIRGAGGVDLPMSVRQLEKMAICPFRYFAESILHLSNPSEQGEDLDPAQGGDLLHRCVEGVYRHLVDQNLFPLTKTPADTLYQIVDSTLSDILHTWEQSSARIHPQLFHLRGQRIRRQVLKLIQLEYQSSPSEQPTYFEYSFGSHGENTLTCLPIPSPEGDETLYLRGRIDRIDVDGDRMVVVDYKSGTLSSVEDKLKRGELGHFEMQLMVYMWVTRLLMKAASSDAAYLAMARVERVNLGAKVQRWRGGQGELWLEWALETNPQHRRELANQAEAPFNLADHLWRLTRQIRAGDFRVDPHDCSYCPVRTGCRVLHFSQPEDEE